MKSKNQPSSSDALSVFAFLCCCCTRAFVWHIVILATPAPAAAAAAALTVSSSSPSPSSSLLGQETRAASTQTASTRTTTISNATKTCLATDSATPTLTDHDDDSKHAENKHHHSSSSSPSGSNATPAPPQYQSDCQPMQTVKSGPNQESLLDSFSEPPGTTAPACGVYLAASTIPGAGLGLFAGQDYDIGQTVGQEEVCWPVIDIQWYVRTFVRMDGWMYVRACVRFQPHWRRSVSKAFRTRRAHTVLGWYGASSRRKTAKHILTVCLCHVRVF